MFKLVSRNLKYNFKLKRKESIEPSQKHQGVINMRIIKDKSANQKRMSNCQRGKRKIVNKYKYPQSTEQKYEKCCMAITLIKAQ